MEWKDEYPRLYSLFESSDQGNEKNYFSLMSNDFKRKSGKVTYQNWEDILSQLRPKAFDCLIQKSKRAVTICQGKRGWEQLFNSLNEARGYLFLKEQGYKSIEFIKATSESTPDLYAKSEDTSALLEVKTIRKSDVNIKRDRVWQGIDNIPDGLKNKINSDVDNAIKQFNSFGVKVDNKICYLIISLDLALDMDPRNRDRLGDYIESIDRSGVQVEYELHSA